MLRHYDAAHTDKRHQCPQCNGWFKNVAVHISQTHKNKNRYPCDQVIDDRALCQKSAKIFCCRTATVALLFCCSAARSTVVQHFIVYVYSTLNHPLMHLIAIHSIMSLKHSILNSL